MLWQLTVWLLSILILFLPAGTLAWPASWIFFMVFFGFVLVLSVWLLIYDPYLLAERLVIIRYDQPAWDRVWVLCFYLLSLVWLALMPLDAMRLRWTLMSVFLRVIGILLFLCALGGIFVTIRENRYLSPLARLQKERGHTVITTGPYQYIRHPLYAAASLFYLGVPLLLGSWYGVACVPLFIGLLVLRCRLT